MMKTRTRKNPISADAVARQADNGKDISRFFTNAGKMTKPIRAKHVFCVKMYA